MERVNIHWSDVKSRLMGILEKLELLSIQKSKKIAVYGIPRGGIFIACMLVTPSCYLVEDPEDADAFVDDIIDSGKTRESYRELIGCDLPFLALYDKLERDKEYQGKWISFPWERMINEEGPEENIRRIIEFIGDDPNREGLKETPSRVIKSFERLYGGYKQDPVDVLKVFQEGSEEMVLLKDIEFFSVCEHHMLPFFGKAHIAYIPSGKVIGISKLARLLEIFARRLQIQERLCQQVTKAMDEILKPLGSACILEAKHLCMVSRGVEKQHSIMTTSSLTGCFREDNRARQELMNLIKS